MKYFFALIFLVQLVSVAAEDPVGKVQATAQVLDCANRIYQIASSNTDLSATQIQDRVTVIVSTLNTKDQLVAFAVVCKGILGPQNAGDEKFDVIFDKAFWKTIEMLSQLPANNGLDALWELESKIALHDGDKIIFDNYIRQLRKR